MIHTHTHTLQKQCNYYPNIYVSTPVPYAAEKSDKLMMWQEPTVYPWEAEAADT